ncbi:MAG: metallophosphoesterase, partial [Rhodoferax sp.]|nr:metallophosphoesterase [Rhodoferax sp.]
MSLTPLVLLLMLLHGWVGWRLAPSLALWSPLAASVLWIVLAASLVLMPLAFTGRRRQARGALATSATWAGLIGMGLFSTLFVLTLVRDAVLVAALLVAVAAGLAGAGWISLEPWMGASAVAVPVLALLATAWGFWNARRTATVVRVDVPIAGLPEALHGFSVAQISDIHVGPTIGQRYVQRIVDRVNALGADMVAITGDLVDGQVD